MPEVYVPRSSSSVGRLSAATAPPDSRSHRSTAPGHRRRSLAAASRRSLSPTTSTGSGTTTTTTTEACRYCNRRRTATARPHYTCSSCGEDIEDDDDVAVTDTGAETGSRRPDTASSLESFRTGNGSACPKKEWVENLPATVSIFLLCVLVSSLYYSSKILK